MTTEKKPNGKRKSREQLVIDRLIEQAFIVFKPPPLDPDGEKLPPPSK
jgi:hypothetical protein